MKRYTLTFDSYYWERQKVRMFTYSLPLSTLRREASKWTVDRLLATYQVTNIKTIRSFNWSKTLPCIVIWYVLLPNRNLHIWNFFFVLFFLRYFPLYNFIFEANIHPLYVAEIRFRCRVGKRHAIEDFYNELRYVKIYKIIVKYATILNNNFHYF